MAYEQLIRTRNAVEHWVYTRIAKPLFFRFDPEWIHDRVSSFGVLLGGNPLTRGLTSLLFSYTHPSMEQDLLGIHFRNPIGLAAGFDKNVRLTKIIPQVGFGWMEVGSITARPCKGNSGSRLKRLLHSRALLINYGLMNNGADAAYERLFGRKLAIPVGTSLAPTNDELTMEYEQAIEDYVYSYKKLSKVGAYTTLNLSCPNTCNDQPFIEPDNLDKLLTAIKKVPSKKPIMLKLSPDLTWERLDTLLAVAKKHGVDGVICTNLTKKRDMVAIEDKEIPARGGLSGKVLTNRSDAMIAHIATNWKHDFVIVGCGGVFSAQDAYRKIKLGASLIQMITGMVFEGPQVISMINQGMVQLLHRDGYASLSEAIGKDLK